MAQRQRQSAPAATVPASQKQAQSRRHAAPDDNERPDRSDSGSIPPAQSIDRHFDVGSGEEETEDGLDPMTETVRQAAEGETPEERSDEIPVFDRANRSEKI